MIEARFLPLTARAPEGSRTVRPVAALDLYAGTGGTELGSTRCRAFLTPEGRAQAAKSVSDVDGLVVIGGNGSLSGATLLSREHGVRVVGIPASIDNDIGCTSMALGVDTALNTIVQACERISDTARAHRRAFVVEVSPALHAFSTRAADADRYAAARRGRACHRARTSRARGSPSYFDRMLAGRFALAAIEALRSGARSEMVSYEPTVTGGAPTNDPSVFRFSLKRVIAESERSTGETSSERRPKLSIIERLEGELGL